MGFFKNLFNSASAALGLGKGTSGIGGLINKAKSFIGSGLSALNSKPGKAIVGALSQWAPSVGDAISSAKKYGHMANSLLSGGAEKVGERFIQSSPILQQMDRWDRPTRHVKYHTQDKLHRPHTIEKTRPPDDDYGTQTMFA
jgi:hypothetical protein